jgi:hypothetical protein
MSLTKLERPGRFGAEADMLAPLALVASKLATNPLVLFEIPCSAGVPDMVLLELDKAAMTKRNGAEPLTEPIDVRVMLAMASVRSPLKRFWDIDELASAVGASAAHLRRTVLPRLAETSHITVDGTRWAPAYKFRSLARRLVTIEAKLRDWRGGVAQASRHTAVADAAWVALDARTVATAANHPEWFSTYGVGLLSVSSSGEVDPLISPARTCPRQPDRELLAERAVALHVSGKVSGPLPMVFGNVLVASRGADPRLVGAGAS